MTCVCCGIGFLSNSDSGQGDRSLEQGRADDALPDSGSEDDSLAVQGDSLAVQDDALERIEAGGIPLATERRLQGLSVEGSMFISGLSVKEYALLDTIGPRPLAQVQGASVYQVGWQYLPPPERGFGEVGLRGAHSGESIAGQQREYLWQETVICELETVTRAWDQARRRALDRLSEEAVQVGADAVVGVKLRQGEHDWPEGSIDYLVSGTAIRWRRQGESQWPALTDLSLQDYWCLLQAGHEPVGLLATTSVMFVSPSQAARLSRMQTISRTQEIEELGKAFQSARDTVRARLCGQIDANNGIGAVGVQITHTVHEQEIPLEASMPPNARRGAGRGQLGLPTYTTGRSDVERKGWVITMHASGTAIRRRDTDPVYPPEMTMRYGGR